METEQESYEEYSYSSTDSDESAISLTVTLDFDPVEFQTSVRKAITSYEACYDTYLQWKVLPEKLKLKLQVKLDKNVLKMEEEKPLTPWSLQDLDDFREEARMKILVSTLDEFTIANPNWEKDPKIPWIPEHNLRMDMKILIFRLSSVITKLLEWNKEKGRTQPDDPKEPIHQASLFTFAFTTNTDGHKLRRSLQLINSNPQRLTLGRQKSKKEKQRLDNNLNFEESPPVSFSGSNTSDFLGTFDFQGPESTEKENSNEFKLNPQSFDDDDGSVLPFCSSSHSQLDDGDDLPLRCESQIYNFEVAEAEVALDLNVNEVYDKSSNSSKKEIKRTYRKQSRDDGNTDSGRSWVTIESSSTEELGSSEEDAGNYGSYSRDDIETSGTVKGEVRSGSRLVYCLFFGAIFLTLFVAGLFATIISLYRSYFE